MKRAFVLLTAFAMVAPAVAGARKLADRVAHYKIDIPKGWAVEQYGWSADRRSRVLKLSSPRRSVRVLLRATPYRDRVDLVAYLKSFEREVLAKRSKAFRRLTGGRVNEGGRRGFVMLYEALAKRRTNLHEYRVMLTVYESLGQKTIFAVAVFLMDRRSDHYDKIISHLLQSIEPTRTPAVRRGKR